jgi:hypothetical protein
MTTKECVLHEMLEHELTVIVDAEKVECYRCGKPDTGIYAFYVTFTPAGICIQGDITPERHGSVSAGGYGVDWFSGHLSPGYLCEKFLTPKFTATVAEQELRDPANLLRDDATPEQLRALDEAADGLCDYGDNGGAWLHEQLSDAGFTVDEDVPGWGYRPQEADILVAIQCKFAELYNKHIGSQP